MKRFFLVCSLMLVQAAFGTSAFAQQVKNIQVLWLGQSAFKITTPTGKVIVIDPWLTKGPKAPAQYKDLAALGKIDLLLVTHAHGDHLGDAPALAKMHNIALWGPGGMNQSLLTLGVLPAAQLPRFDKGGKIHPLPGITVTATHAEHSSALVLPNAATGKDETHYGGEPNGFIIELENGFKIYHMGDTGIFGDMKWIGEYYKPDLVLIPVGGNFTMDPADAAYATKELLKPRYAIPMHYGSNPLGKGTPREYVDALGSALVKVIVLAPGEVAEF
jgi:L-ascorbate metabolism protein UlaG (beta-lactamase superfamily)